MNHTQQFAMSERRLHHEMRQKTNLRDTFFGLKTEPQRPSSVATEFMDTDWDEEILSEAEDNSPRVSVNSSGQPSITTLSSYDEIPTPRSSQSRMAYVEAESPKAVEGPRGPHLFRSSTANSFEQEAILSLSPMTPKVSRPYHDILSYSAPRESLMPRRRSSPFQFSREELNTPELASWSPEMVAQSMLNAGVELSVAERFVENDINGAILITLKFEDLKELDIQSFGVRTKIWNQIHLLRDSRPSSPRAPTPIEDRPSREVKKEQKKESDCGLQRRKSSRRRHKKPSHEDIISPMESVSIVGIEQVIPKPHVCSKGENCSKFRKQQKLIDSFRKEHPFVDLDAGAVLIAGDPGNPQTARAIDPTEMLRPISDAVPSVVASSDVFGPGSMTPLQYLQEAALRNVQSRDPQDNVRRFLDLQCTTKGNEVPPTPPFEIFPQSHAPIEGLRALPKLSIPGKQSARPTPPRASTHPPPNAQPAQPVQQQEEQPFIPYRMDRADPLSPDLQTPTNPYRFGTPFSEFDVPVTAIPIGPVARNFSQSVPPDMNYHTVSSIPPPRAQSRASARRPSFPVLPALDENMATPIARAIPKPLSPRSSSQPQQKPLQAPPRVNYPWSPMERKNFEQAIPPSIPVKEAAELSFQNGISYQGPMKKRKTRLLRHEWQDGYFTLKGSRLAMHKDAIQIDRTLEYVDIDDYAIACSSLASQSKLTAAFKAMQITHNREKSDPVAAFSFQLIPQDKNAAKLRKRESALPGGVIPPEGANGTGKTHHFAVKSRDERIDWMRELMLAKALRQKGEGFEVSVNGNMI